MKTYRVKTVGKSDTELVESVLRSLQQKGIIVFEEENTGPKETAPATEEQVQEIIDEAEIGPYYSESEARKILNL